MTINDAVEAIDQFLERYTGRGGLRPVERRVLPSAEDNDVVKVWVDLGPPGVRCSPAPRRREAGESMRGRSGRCRGGTRRRGPGRIP